MSLNESGISWTDGTLNSLYGCRECSVGCRLCYAVNRVYRQSTNPKRNTDGRLNKLVVQLKNDHQGDQEAKRRFTGVLLFEPGHLYAVLRDKEPKRVFVNEFSDLFFESLPMELILEHIRVFNVALWHQFQILTKRNQRLEEVNGAVLKEFGDWPVNVWLGVSVCSAAKTEMKRIDDLGKTAAGIKWVSFEPWISDLNTPLDRSIPDMQERLRRNRIAWVVVGGESGAKRDTNLMTLEDARFLINEAKAAGCRVHFKQLGTALALQLGVYSTDGEHRAKGGAADQWPADLNIDELPTTTKSTYMAPDRFSCLYRAGEWQQFGSHDSQGNGERTTESSLRDRLLMWFRSLRTGAARSTQLQSNWGN